MHNGDNVVLEKVTYPLVVIPRSFGDNLRIVAWLAVFGYPFWG